MRMASLLVLPLLLVFAFAGGVGAREESPGAVVIDVRTEQEWKGGHLEGAILIPHDRIEKDVAAAVPDKKTRITLYCRTGRRSGLAYDALKKGGYENVANLGTMENAAKELKLPIVK